MVINDYVWVTRDETDNVSHEAYVRCDYIPQYVSEMTQIFADNGDFLTMENNQYLLPCVAEEDIQTAKQFREQYEEDYINAMRGGEEKIMFEIDGEKFLADNYETIGDGQIEVDEDEMDYIGNPDQCEWGWYFGC